MSIYPGGAAWASEPCNGYIRTTSTSASAPRAYNIGSFGTAPTLLGDLTGQRVQADFRRVGQLETLAGTAPTVRMVILSSATDNSQYGRNASNRLTNLSA